MADDSWVSASISRPDGWAGSRSRSYITEPPFPVDGGIARPCSRPSMIGNTYASGDSTSSVPVVLCCVRLVTTNCGGVPSVLEMYSVSSPSATWITFRDVEYFPPCVTRCATVITIPARIPMITSTTSISMMVMMPAHPPADLGLFVRAFASP